MLRALILTCCLMAAPAFAEAAVLTIGQDRYAAGASVRFDGPAVQDLFMAGNRVVVAAPPQWTPMIIICLRRLALLRG